MKEDEIDIHFECKFSPSKELNMRLQLSHDRGKIVLPIIHSGTDNTSISLMMWDIHSLRAIKLTQEIKNSLKKLPKGKLMEANFIGINEHVMITLQRTSDDRQRSKYMEYFIFNAENGNIELRIDNQKKAVLKESIM